MLDPYKPQPFIISVTSYGTEYIVRKPASDVPLDELMSAFKGLAVQMGFNPDAVEEYFKPNGGSCRDEIRDYILFHTENEKPITMALVLEAYDQCFDS